jgi:SAM-dependent methyltransferase
MNHPPEAARIRSVARALRLGDGVRRLFGRFVADERRALAKRFLEGRGIEIGPLHRPQQIGPNARLRAVDRLPLAKLRRHYPELAEFKLTAPDVIDDGERLTRFADGSLDFVVANHFLEHCQDPIGAIKTFLRVLRPGGRLFMAVPDQRFTFDAGRPTTPFEHLRRDHETGPAGSFEAHLREWAERVEKVAPDRLEARVEELRRQGYSIHFHCWTQAELLELVVRLKQELKLPVELVEFLQNGPECVLILQRV